MTCFPSRKPSCHSGQALRHIVLIICFAALLALASVPLFKGNASQVKESVHGPVIQWHREPSTIATLIWVYHGSASSLEEAEEVDNWVMAIRPNGNEKAFKALPVEVSVFGKTGVPVFTAEASQLVPDTAYAYRLEFKGEPVDEGWFRTAPAVLEEPLQFIVGGDMGTVQAIPICQQAAKEDPLFAAVGGDIAYANGRNPQLWYDWLDIWNEYMETDEGRSIPIIAAIGNHEMKSYQGLKGVRRITGMRLYRKRRANAPFYYSLFDLPNDWSNFSVDFENYLSIIVLDSNHSQKVERQTDWLEGQLEERQAFDNLFVLYHRPAWGTGIKENSTDIQEEWCPLFEEYQVDCVFENDHHAYKRTHPLKDGEVDRESGILYIGDGAWGARLRPITPTMLESVDADEYLAAYASVHHVVKVTLHPDGRRSYEAIDEDGTVFDETSDSRDRRGNQTTDESKDS